MGRHCPREQPPEHRPSKVYIIGINDSSQLANFYLTRDSDHEVLGYCVHGDRLPEEPSVGGVGVYRLEDLVASVDPNEVRFFAPLYAKGMNWDRRRIYDSVKRQGFGFASYVSSRATVFTDRIGENAFVGEDCTLQPFTSVGDNTVVWAGNHVGHHSRVGSHCYVAGHVAISGRVTIEDHCFFGGNCTVRDGIKIGEGTLVVMDSSVMGDTDPWSVWRGAPARRMEGKSSTEIKL